MSLEDLEDQSEDEDEDGYAGDISCGNDGDVDGSSSGGEV